MNPLTNYPANTIYLPIKRKWFDMILSGEKEEEYRDVKPYWAVRLCDWHEYILDYTDNVKGTCNVPIDAKRGKTTLTLTAGYGSDKPRLVVELLGIKIKHPNPAWCPPNTQGLWFALELGEVLKTENI